MNLYQFCKAVLVPLRMYCNNFGEPLSFHFRNVSVTNNLMTISFGFTVFSAN